MLSKSQKFLQEAQIFNACNPVVAMDNCGNGVAIVKRKSLLQNNFINPKNGRKERNIKMLTRSSLSRLMATVQATDIQFSTILTLTYPEFYPKNGTIVKEDLNRVLARMRTWGKVSYLWFVEFQERNAPHLHILTSHNGISPRMRIDVTETWVGGIVKSDWFLEACEFDALKRNKKCVMEIISQEIRKSFGFTIHPKSWELVRDRDGAKKYAGKYATKPGQKIVPDEFADIGRFWGCSKDVCLKPLMRIITDDTTLRQYLNSNSHPTAEMEILPKYLWNIPSIA